MEKLADLMKYESEQMEREFAKASACGKGTPQEVADFREGYFHKFITRYFPFPYRVAKGIISDIRGSSNSIDCIILNPQHPFTVDSTDRFSIIFADGVDCAIEVKPDISRKSELVRGLEQIRSVKKLRRRNSSVVLKNKYPKEILDHSQRIPCFIFAIQGKSDIANTVDDIVEYYCENQVPLEEQFDYIIINGKGIIANYKHPKLNPHPYNRDVPKDGYWFERFEENTIGAFLLYLNMVFPSTIRLSAPVISEYLSILISIGTIGKMDIYLSFGKFEEMMSRHEKRKGKED